MPGALACSCSADRPIVGCHPVGRGCGRTRFRVLGANARFPTEYDSKGDGLMRLAGHATHTGSGRSAHVLATVERPASGSTAQLGRPFFHTPQSMTHRLSKLSQQHTPSSTYTHTCLFKIITLSHAHTHTHSFTHHLSSHTFFHAQLSHTTL